MSCYWDEAQWEFLINSADRGSEASQENPADGTKPSNESNWESHLPVSSSENNKQ